MNLRQQDVVFILPHKGHPQYPQKEESERERERHDFSPLLNYAQHFELALSIWRALSFFRSRPTYLNLLLLHNTLALLSLVPPGSTEIAVSFLPSFLHPLRTRKESRGCEGANFHLHKTAADAENGFSVGECGGQREGGSGIASDGSIGQPREGGRWQTGEREREEERAKQ